MGAMTMNQISDFTVQIGGRTLPVIRLDGAGIYVEPVADLVGHDGPARFTLTREGRTWVGDISVRAEGATEGVKLTLSGPPDERRRFVSVLNWYGGRETSFLGHFADTPKQVGSTKGLQRRQVAAAFGLGVLSLTLIAAISEILVQRAVNTTSRVAYVTTPGNELDSVTAGKVVFVKTGGLLEKGEFFAALKTSSGYQKFLEATTSGDVSAPAAGPNDYVRKGMPVVRVSDEGAVPHVVAFVRFSDAVAALNSPQAQIEFPRSDRSLSVPRGWMSYVNSARVMTDDDGKPLAEIKLRLPEGVDVPSDEPVVVKFGRPIDGLNLLPRQWLNTLSALLS